MVLELCYKNLWVSVIYPNKIYVCIYQVHTHPIMISNVSINSYKYHVEILIFISNMDCITTIFYNRSKEKKKINTPLLHQQKVLISLPHQSYTKILKNIYKKFNDKRLGLSHNYFPVRSFNCTNILR